MTEETVSKTSDTDAAEEIDEAINAVVINLQVMELQPNGHQLYLGGFIGAKLAPATPGILGPIVGSFGLTLSLLGLHEARTTLGLYCACAEEDAENNHQPQITFLKDVLRLVDKHQLSANVSADEWYALAAQMKALAPEAFN